MLRWTMKKNIAAYALRDRLQTESLESGVLMTQVRYAIRVK